MCYGVFTVARRSPPTPTAYVPSYSCTSIVHFPRRTRTIRAAHDQRTIPKLYSYTYRVLECYTEPAPQPARRRRFPLAPPTPIWRVSHTCLAPPPRTHCSLACSPATAAVTTTSRRGRARSALARCLPGARLTHGSALGARLTHGSALGARLSARLRGRGRCRPTRRRRPRAPPCAAARARAARTGSRSRAE